MANSAIYLEVFGYIVIAWVWLEQYLDGLVRVDELVAAVNIAIGDGNVNDCQAADVNIDDEVSIDELISSVGSALTGCQLP